MARRGEGRGGAARVWVEEPPEPLTWERRGGWSSCVTLYYFCCLMFYAESQCLLNIPCYFFCRFDKELNKEVAIKVIDLEEA